MFGHAAAWPVLSVQPSAQMKPANHPEVLWHRPVDKQMSLSGEVPFKAQQALNSAFGLHGLWVPSSTCPSIE